MENVKDIEELNKLLETSSTPVMSSDEPVQQDLLSGIISEEPAKPKTAKELLDTVKVDLSSINIMRVDNPLGIHQELNAIYLKPSYEVIALQSGYRVSMKALNNDDMLKVRKFSGTEKEQNMKLFNFIYRNMENLSIGKVDFDTWLRITSEADYETFMYGMFCATFPHDTDYSVKCPECGHVNNVKINKESLIRAVNVQETSEYVSKILNGNHSAKDIVKHSLVNFEKRIMLPESKAVIDLRTPTLYDYVQSLNNAERFKSVEPEIFGYLKHIKNIYIPHLAALAQGRSEYLELENIEDKLTVINKMSKEDKKYLESELFEKANKFKVEYKLPNITCSACGHSISDINVDMTEILFLNIVGAF